jgi:transposase-like protein
MSDLINLSFLIDDAKCFELVRQHRWPEGVQCPRCGRPEVVRNGRDETQRDRQRYLCHGCRERFDDLTGTVLAGHHQPLRIWVLCLYFMGLNLSNRQIAGELGIGESEVQAMTSHLREGLVVKLPEVVLDGEVEMMKSTWWPVIRATRGRFKKRPEGPPEPTQRGARPGNIGEGETGDPRSDPAGWPSCPEDAGECSAGDDPADHHQGRQRRGHGLYRRV